jgi:hypothetical protein
MKKQLFIAIAALMAFSSCQKSGMHLFRGDYSYKTSGSVTLTEILSDGDTDEPVSFTVNLLNEIGQLEINALGNEKDSLLVVMNTMGGEVVVTHAFCDGREIFLKDFTKNTLLFSGDSITLKNEMRVQASGQMYEDNTIILNMIYDGEAETTNRNFMIHGDNIRMAATRN